MGTDSLITTFTTRPAQAPLADDIVLEDFAQRVGYRGRTAVLPVLRAYFGDGFPDGRMDLHAALHDERTLACRFTFNGRQDGRFLGIPATGRRVSVPMCVICRIGNGRIGHIALYYDAATLLQQLGLV